MKKFFIFCGLFFLYAPAWAGIYPKPEMNFTLVYTTEQKPTVLPDTSEQLQCQDNQCLQSEALGHYGIQKLYCQPTGCFSIAYEYAPYQQLILDFSDGIKRSSPVFATPSKLRNNFQVVVREKDLQVTLAPSPKEVNALLRVDAWSSLLIILLLELMAAWAYLSYTRKSYLILISVFFVNLITMPVSWQILANWITEPWLLWSFCLVFEAVFLWLLNRKRLQIRDAFNLSIAINVTSYTLGMIFSFLLAPYLF